MWTVRSEELRDGWGYQYTLHLESRPATVHDFLEALRTDPEFRSYFNSQLSEAPYKAFRWETPAITRKSTGQPFEFVLLDAPKLLRKPDPEAFAEHFARAQSAITTFPNLGGDAIMVVPCPRGEPKAYATWVRLVVLQPKISVTPCGKQLAKQWHCVLETSQCG
jgi:hypothetical protein